MEEKKELPPSILKRLRREFGIDEEMRMRTAVFISILLRIDLESALEKLLDPDFLFQAIKLLIEFNPDFERSEDENWTSVRKKYEAIKLEEEE